VKVLNEDVFSYGWTLNWKQSQKIHLISVLVALQVLNETEMMDQILKDWFEQMEVKLLARVVMWNQVIAAAIKRSVQICAIENMMTRMKLQGLQPDVVTWSTLMNAHAGKGDAAACERVMRDMQKAGLVEHTDERSCWENRCCCVRTGDADHAEGGA